MITRYILKEFFRTFLVAALALALIELSVDFLEKIRDFYKHDPEFYWLLSYFLLRLLRVFFDLLPLAILLSTLITFGGLSKSSEITAFKSSGISVFRLAFPILIFGLAISLLSYHLSGTLIPKGYGKAEFIRLVHLEKKKPSVGFVQNKTWLHLDRQRLIYVQVVSADRTRMQGVRLYVLGENFQMTQEIEAAELVFEKGGWTLLNGSNWKFLSDGKVEYSAFTREKIKINKTPADFQGAEIEVKEMTYEDLKSYIAQLASAGFDPTRYQVDLRAKQALPFVNFMMVLLGVSFALKDSRSAGIAGGIAICLTITLFYWLVFSVTLSLGRLEILPPWLAAWSANILLLSVGSYLFLNMRQ